MADLKFPWLNVPNLLKDISTGAGTLYAKAFVPVDATGSVIGSAGTPTNAVVTQPTASNLNAQVVGNIASGSADVGNPVKAGGIYNSALPTFTTGQRADLQLSSKGTVLTSATIPSGTQQTGNTPGDAVNNGGIVGLDNRSFNYAYNGTTWDRVYSATAVNATTGIGIPASGVVGKYNVTVPTYTDGQYGNLQLDVQGNVRVSLGGIVTSGSDALPNTSFTGVASYNGSGITPRYLANMPLKFNGSSWDRERKTNITTRVGSSAASGNPAFLKSSAGDVVGFWGQTAATAVFLQIYNKASAPTIGTDTPILTYPIPANTYFTQMIPNGGYYLSTGIAFAFTTDAAGTTGSAAAAVLAFNLFGA